MKLSCSPIFDIEIPEGPLPKAVIVNYDNIANTANATGTIGSQLYLLILREEAIVEFTLPETNTGNNQINFNTTLENGDTLCIRSSFDGFIFYDMDCKTIPSPDFGFVPIS